MMHRRGAAREVAVGVRQAREPKGPRWVAVAACATTIALMGATCWSWGGHQQRSMDGRQALQALADGQDTTSVLQAEAKRIVVALRAVAAGNDARAAHARHALATIEQALKENR